MRTFRLIIALVLVVGLIGVFPALGAEQTTTEKKGTPVTEKKESKDQKKAPAPGSTTMQAPATTVQSLPLSIKRLYLKDCKVHVVITKQGGERLSDEDFAATKLKVEASTLKKPLEWTLLEVDPHKRFTRRIRREQDFDTGLEIKERVRVKATLYRGLWKTAKEETLSPTMAAVAVKTRMAAPEQKKGITDQLVAQVSASRLPIEIFTPSEGRIFRRGETINVRYRISTPTAAGVVMFRLISPTHGQLFMRTHYYVPPDLSAVDWSEAELEPTGVGLGTGAFSLGSTEDDGEPLGIGDVVFAWTVPMRLPFGDDYYVQAKKGGLLGRSATFSIGEWATITVTAPILPAGEEEVQKGWGIYFRWESSEPLRCTAHLIKGDEIVKSLAMGRWGPCTELDDQFHSDTLVPGDDYKVRVVNNANLSNWGESRTFTVREPD